MTASLAGKPWAKTFFDEGLPDLFLEEIQSSIAAFNGAPEGIIRNYHDLLSGNNVHRNPTSAIYWLRSTVSKEHPEALYDIAHRHRTGDGVFQSEASYFTHLMLAARGNYPPAQKGLGEYYLSKGVEIYEKHEALVWLIRAQKNGLDVTQQIHDAEKQLDIQHRTWAREKAANFDLT